MKNILTLLFTFWTFFCEAQHTFFQVNSNYVAPSLAVLTSTSASSIGTNSATSGGTISKDGGSYVISRGVVWSTSQSPTIESSSKTFDGSGIGSFTSSITGLASSTTYYIRAFAINSVGTSYGAQTSFTTSEPIYTVTSATGRIWMDRNLGATRVATSVTDQAAYGDLYQWGRLKDGHQLRTSGTTGTASVSDIPGNALFITQADWRSPQNNNLWQGVNGINNPCPSGFRIPTQAEWQAEINTWTTQNQSGAFSSPLKLTSAGFRQSSGAYTNDGAWADYWTSTVNGSQAFRMNFYSGGADYTSSLDRGWGFSCRCIKD